MMSDGTGPDWDQPYWPLRLLPDPEVTPARPYRVMLIPDDLQFPDVEEMIQTIRQYSGMIVIRGPKELLDQIRVL